MSISKFISYFSPVSGRPTVDGLKFFQNFYTKAETDSLVELTKQQIEAWVAANFVVSLYSEIRGPTGIPASLGAGWERITNYATEVGGESRGVTPNLANGTLQFDYPGRYYLSIRLNIEHDESNAGRTTRMRLINTLDDTVIGTSEGIGIGRNQPATNDAIVLEVPVDASTAGVPIAVEFGGGDAITVSAMNVGYGIFSIGPWLEPIGSGGFGISGAGSLPAGGEIGQIIVNTGPGQGEWQDRYMAVEPENMISVELDTNGDGTGTKEAIGDYSGVGLGETDFKITAIANDFHIARMIVSLRDTSMRAEYYGSSSALTNGVEVLVTDSLGATIVDLTPDPVKSIAEWTELCFDGDVKTWGAGDELFVARWTFEKSGSPIVLNPGESLVVRLNDDFTTLSEHQFVVQGVKR